MLEYKFGKKHRYTNPGLHRTSDGFTIAEVSIATGIFSVVLLVGLASFLSLGRLFYKGIASSQTQTASQQILQDINGSIQNGQTVTGPFLNVNGYNYYCLGNTRYTFQINTYPAASGDTLNHDAGGNFALLKDVPLGGCAPPCSDADAVCAISGATPLNHPLELIGQNMRLDDLKINQECTPTCNGVYDVSIVVVYGSDDVLDYTIKTPLIHYDTVFCAGSTSDNQYCAVNSTKTSVFKGQNF